CVRRNTSRASGTEATSVTVSRNSLTACVSRSIHSAYSANTGRDITAAIAKRLAHTLSPTTVSSSPTVLLSIGASSSSRLLYATQAADAYQKKTVSSGRSYKLPV